MKSSFNSCWTLSCCRTLKFLSFSECSFRKLKKSPQIFKGISLFFPQPWDLHYSNIQISIEIIFRYWLYYRVRGLWNSYLFQNLALESSKKIIQKFIIGVSLFLPYSLDVHCSVNQILIENIFRYLLYCCARGLWKSYPFQILSLETVKK